jgi:hypothetical protein
MPSTGTPVTAAPGGGAEPELGALLQAAQADLGRVCAWMEGEALPGGPALLVKRARARLAAVCAYLDTLDEELPPPTAGEVPGSLAARALTRRPPGGSTRPASRPRPAPDASA